MILSVRDLCYNFLGYSPDQVRSIIRNKSEYYYHFYKIKRDYLGKPKRKNGEIQRRRIEPSKSELKDIHNKILDRILKKIDLPDYIMGGREGVSNLDNARAHLGKKFRFQTDIKSFFPNIDKERVRLMFLGHGFSKQVADLLAELCTLRDQLPQGIPPSTYIANLVFLPIDKKIIEIIADLDITYTRWVDDLTFSSTYDFQDLHQAIIKAVCNRGFSISRGKTTYRTKKSEITGATVRNNVLSPTKKFIEKGKLRLKDKQIRGRDNYYKQLKEK